MAIPKEWRHFLILMGTVLWTFFCAILIFVVAVIIGIEKEVQTDAGTWSTLVDAAGLSFFLWLLGTTTMLGAYFMFGRD